MHFAQLTALLVASFAVVSAQTEAQVVSLFLLSARSRLRTLSANPHAELVERSVQLLPL